MVFKKGTIPWNKGLTKETSNLVKQYSEKKTGKKLSEEVKKKMSEANSGKNHPNFGKHRSEETKKKIGDAQKFEKHHDWKGDEAGYQALHIWIRKILGKANKCSNNSTHKGSYQWANISGEYKRNITDWHELCISCNHKDGIHIPERLRIR